MKTTAIIAAAGAGARMGAGRPKAFLDLAGRAVLAYSLETLDRHPRVDGIVLLVPRAMLEEAERLAAEFGKVIEVAPGGPRRQDSVRIGLSLVPGDAPGSGDLVLVHDAARPLVEPDLIDRVMDAAVRSGAAVPGLRPAETVRRVARCAAGEATAAGTLDRESLVLVQTPQAFRREILIQGFERWGQEEATDEAILVERLGLPVSVVRGSARNLKITTREDLAVAEMFLRESGGFR